MNSDIFKWLGLQLFAGGGDGGDGAEGAEGTAGDTTPDAGESRLRELGVPESVLERRAKRAGRSISRPVADESLKQDAAAENTTPTESTDPEPHKRMTWDEIMADPEYNRQMQSTMQARLKTAKAAEETLGKLAPAFELLGRRYGLDPKNLDADALTKAISDDDSYYEDKAIEMGVSIDAAKQIDQNERNAERKHEEEARIIEQQRIETHIAKLKEQGEAMKTVFPNFDLAAELRNPAFARMTSPNINISVEDAYYAVHRKEIQTAAMQATAQKTAQQMANNIRSGQQRPVENGTRAQAPSNTSFDYAHASKEQREALKRQIREAAARGEKLYPGK